jgi:ArsR family transcriptional regulator
MHATAEATRDGACEAIVVDPGAVDRVRARLASPARRKSACDIQAAVGDPTRHTILEALAVEPLCVCDLAEVTGVSQSGVSHQLRVLRDLDLVAFEREGKRAVYRLADEHVRVLLAAGLEHAAERGGER